MSPFTVGGPWGAVRGALHVLSDCIYEAMSHNNGMRGMCNPGSSRFVVVDNQGHLGSWLLKAKKPGSSGIVVAKRR